MATVQGFCTTHPDQYALGACATCGRPLCAACRVENLAEERAYCSPACLAAASARSLHPGRTAPELADALRSPIRSGWRLWLRSAGLSRAHTGAAGGSPWPHVAPRLLPWAATWLVYGVVVGVGSLLILPGMLAAIRLFWADEFALVHGVGPRAALRESLRLTRGLAGRIFGFQFLLCGTWWSPSDYRTDVAVIYCSACKEALQRPAPANPA
jgi:hypothetical protein